MKLYGRPPPRVLLPRFPPVFWFPLGGGLERGALGVVDDAGGGLYDGVLFPVFVFPRREPPSLLPRYVGVYFGTVELPRSRPREVPTRESVPRPSRRSVERLRSTVALRLFPSLRTLRSAGLYDSLRVPPVVLIEFPVLGKLTFEGE